MIILDGKKVKTEILDELKEVVNTMEVKPHLVVIQVGNNEASNVYIREKEKMANYIGYKFTHYKLNEDVSEEDLLKMIDDLNKDYKVHGILVQMPLPKHINEKVIQNAIVSYKDVDGLTDNNSGKLFHGIDALYPCTPSGVMELLKRYDIDVRGRNAVVVGRSDLVGKPMAMMLTNAGATVTICHSKTVDLKKHTLMADILVVATGKSNLITEDMVSPGTVVIDVGINRNNGKLCGDVDYETVKEKASYITPVPGGVGPMTVAMLGKNVLKAYMMQIDK